MADTFNIYQKFFNAAYAEGAIDRKTKHLIALGASLGATCDKLTTYFLVVARELGATDEELNEATAIAMTVGAARVKILQENTLASLPQKKPAETQMSSGQETTEEQAEGST